MKKQQQESENKVKTGTRDKPSPGNPQALRVVGPRPSLTFVDAYELAEMFGVDVQTIWRLARRGKLPFYDLGRGRKRFDPEEALKCLRCKADEKVKKR